MDIEEQFPGVDVITGERHRGGGAETQRGWGRDTEGGGGETQRGGGGATQRGVGERHRELKLELENFIFQ